MNIKWEFIIPLNDEKSIKEIESKFRIQMPFDLVKLIKDYNAGYPSKNICNIPKLGFRDLKCLLSYNKEDDESIYYVIDYFLEKYNGLAIPFAVDSGSGIYLYTTSGIYYTDNDNIDELFFVAEDIEKFLKLLTEDN